MGPLSSCEKNIACHPQRRKHTRTLFVEVDKEATRTNARRGGAVPCCCVAAAAAAAGVNTSAGVGLVAYPGALHHRACAVNILTHFRPRHTWNTARRASCSCEKTTRVFSSSSTVEP